MHYESERYRDAANGLVINSMRNRFEKNRPLLQSLEFFAPVGFPDLVKNVSTAHDLEAKVRSFCTMYNIDSHRCA
jgi:hypothetical protein